MIPTKSPSESLRACVASARARFDEHARNENIDEHGPAVARALDILKLAARLAVAQNRRAPAGLSLEQQAAFLAAATDFVRAEQAQQHTRLERAQQHKEASR